jgi:hypothetical protein
MRTAAKLFLIAVLSVTLVRGASAYEAPALPMPTVTSGVELNLPAGMLPPAASALETAFLGGGSFDVSFGDDDDYGVDISLGDDDEDDEDDDDADDDDDEDDDGLDICVGDLCDDD